MSQLPPPNDDGIGLIGPEERRIPPTTGPSGSAPEPSAGTATGPASPSGGAAAPAPRSPSVGGTGPLQLRAADDTVRPVTAGTVTDLSAVLSDQRGQAATVELTIEVGYTSTYPGEGAEWPVRWVPPGKRTAVELFARKQTASVPIPAGGSVPLTFEITAPVGVRYGDRLEIRLQARAPDTAGVARLTLACVARQSLLAIKTSRGYEREVADTLLARAEDKPDVLFAMLVPGSLRGYVFAEGMSFEGVHEMLKGIRKARGLVAGETTLKEVEPLLVPQVTVEGFVEGAIVELISGPFKGEKARVKKIDQAKEEITVELIEAVVPIPVTVRGDHVRMLEKGGGKSGG
ncbi:MAG: transcription elongation factor Spt5 [Thermoplasmata archaeon]